MKNITKEEEKKGFSICPVCHEKHKVIEMDQCYSCEKMVCEKCSKAQEKNIGRICNICNGNIYLKQAEGNLKDYINKTNMRGLFLAIEDFGQAKKFGNATAAYNLAKIYLNKEFGLCDTKIAEENLAFADNLGHKEAKALLESIRSKTN